MKKYRIVIDYYELHKQHFPGLAWPPRHSIPADEIVEAYEEKYSQTWYQNDGDYYFDTEEEALTALKNLNLQKPEYGYRIPRTLTGQIAIVEELIFDDDDDEDPSYFWAYVTERTEPYIIQEEEEEED